MKLVVLETPSPIAGLAQTKEFDLHPNTARPVLQVGRHSQSDIMLADATVSRAHLEIIVRPHALLVRDLDSKNGSRLNSTPLLPFKGVLVKPGDRLRIGEVTLMAQASSALSGYQPAEGVTFPTHQSESASPARPSRLTPLLPSAPTPAPSSTPVSFRPASVVPNAPGLFPPPSNSAQPKQPSTSTNASDSLAAPGNFSGLATTSAGLSASAIQSAHLLSPAPTPIPNRLNTTSGYVSDRLNSPSKQVVDRLNSPSEQVPDRLFSPISPQTGQVVPASSNNLSSPAPKRASSEAAFPVSSAQTFLVALPWVCLLVISLAEFLTSAVNYQIGLVIHAALLIGLAAYSAMGPGSARRKLALSLTVAPLIRLLSLSLPLASFPQLVWYPMVAVPLLLAAWIIARQLHISRESMGLQIKNLPLQLGLISGGLGLGAMEYSILRPIPIITNYSWLVGLAAVLSLVLFTGFNEEIIFRGLLQATATVVLERWALVYVALLFAALHIGYLSILDFIFVFVVGLLFGYIVRWSGSILGVALAHGLTNVTLFLIMPYVNQNPNDVLSQNMPWIIAAGCLVALITIGLIVWKALFKEQQDEDQIAMKIGLEILTYSGK